MNEGFLILLADDQAESRDTLRYLLDQLSFEVLEAADGPGAIGIAETDDPDLILLGANLPELDGLETCRELKALSPMFAKIPVILVVDDLDAESLLQAREAGIEDFLVRPFDEDELQQRLMMHVASSRETRTMMRVSQQRGLSTARSARNRMLDDQEHDHGSLTIAAVTQRSEFLGGDVSGFVPLGQHHAGLFVLGVEGRELGPTLLTATLHRLLTLRADLGPLQLSADENGDFLAPTALLDLLQRAFPSEKTGWNHRITYVDLDDRSGAYRFASRGAPPALIASPSGGGVTVLGGEDTPGGTVEGSGVLAPGDLLVVPGSFLGTLAGQGGASFCGAPLEAALRDAVANDPEDPFDEVSTAIVFALDRHLAGAGSPVDIALAIAGYAC